MYNNSHYTGLLKKRKKILHRPDMYQGIQQFVIRYSANIPGNYSGEENNILLSSGIYVVIINYVSCWLCNCLQFAFVKTDAAT